MVEALTPNPLSMVFMVTSKQELELLSQDTAGCGVFDLGATETVGSLEALESLSRLRSGKGCLDLEFQVFSGPSAAKPFRFGNGGIQMSESYVLVPQRLGDELVMLRIYTIDASRVPILVGVKTLEKLGAIIDVEGRCMVLANVSPSLKIQLGKSSAGHLLVGLTSDWPGERQRPQQPVPVGRAIIH